MAHVTRLFLCAAALGITTLAAAPAAAQAVSQPRVEVSANAGALTATSTFTASTTLPSNGGETETITTEYAAKTAFTFNAGAAVRIATQLWLSVQYAMADMKPGASVTAVIPHPILFNAPRTVEGSIDGVAHNERNIHVDLMYALPVRAADVKVMAGPTFFNLKQDLVSGVSINETYPFDTATFAGATTTRVSKSAVGFNAGVDISRPLSSRVGVGGLIRYSRGNVEFDDATTSRATAKAGGLELTGGVRLRF
jgi:hypothetical protein